jgi:hypothetical protein
VGCHLADFNHTTNPNHAAGKFPTTCDTCHNTASWLDATFDHSLSGFALTGAHVTVACAQCHVNGNFTNAPTQCVGCHLADFQKTTTPNHAAVGFSQDCATCHTTANWTTVAFNHATTGFPLVGLHATQQCAACHINNNYSLTNAACWNCHQTDYNGATNPPHLAGGFPQDCTTCHGSLALNWTTATFDHSSTGFTLTGSHVSLQCAQCHVNNNYNLTSGACWNCHQTDYNTANNPPHKAANFPQDCSGCHGTVNWDNATFNHATTGFALVGLHSTQQCTACHVNNNYNLTSTACWSCHQTDYNGANNPPHLSGGFPQDCVPCHGSAALSWTTGSFDHSATGFMLVGVHATQQCAACHVNNNYSLTSAACWNCHQTDYNGANSPPHLAGGFPQDCTSCHGASAVNWTSATFNHATTGFTLVGLHATQQCAACHVNNNYSLTSAACWNCHQTDYNGATNPPHLAGGFPQDCTSCHGSSAVNWTSATFNHSSTGFTLTGAHISLQCAQCHVNNNYSLTSAACWNCHQTDYNGTTNPNHKAANFPQDCSGCHTTTDWTGATFNHSSTGFTLVGAHATQQCAACHVNNNYNITSTACWNCHQADYNGATNPPHLAGGFPQDCTSCHGATAVNWTSATFNHATTGFTLTGAHTSLQCEQ